MQPFLPGVSALFYTERRLVFPGYFPYDWKDPSHDFLYVMTVIYQVGGFAIHAVANMFLDTFPGFLMFMLAVHANNLKLRISRIGDDPTKSTDDNYIDLKTASKDHKALLQMFKLTGETMSAGLFGQFLTTSVNVVISVVVFQFYAEDLFERGFYLALATAYVMEITAASFFGSVATFAMQGLTEGIYSCNWVEQSFNFRKDLKIFMEASLVTHEFVAGGFITVTLKSFVAIMRSSYSLFALLDRMGDRLNF